ncbi:MAG: tetratricopeptide repeat protein [Candidatus Xenobia bacterium]
MRRGTAWMWVVGLGMLLAVPGQCDSGVAQITGVKGGVKDAGHAATMLSSVKAGDAVDVPAGGEVTLFFFKDKHREKIAGPATFKVLADGTNAPAAKKTVTAASGALRVAGGSIAGLNSDQYGGSVKRGGDMEAVRFQMGHRTASLEPTLRWNSVSGASAYVVAVRDDVTAQPLFTKTVKDTSVSLDKQLQPGKTYYCSVTAQDEDQTTVGETRDTLEVLPEAKIKELDAAKKQFDANRGSDRSSYLELAAAYSAEGLPWDAINVLQQLATAVPKSPYPHERMAALYRGLGMPDKAAAEKKLADQLQGKN